MQLRSFIYEAMWVSAEMRSPYILTYIPTLSCTYVCHVVWGMMWASDLILFQSDHLIKLASNFQIKYSFFS